MATCSNCKRGLSCGCQKKTASDGKSVCNNCVTAYEANLKQKATEITVSPTNQVWGKDRYKIAK
jgi:hypothetical protein